MNEQWNNALEQVEDEYLLEAAGYRRKRYWPRVVAAAAAVLALAVGWSFLRPEEPPVVDTTGATAAPAGPDVAAPDSAPGGGFWDSLFGGGQSEITYGTAEEPSTDTTLRFSTYEQLRQICLERQDQFLHDGVAIPCLDGQPMKVTEITALEWELHEQDWVLYSVCVDQQDLTVRVTTDPSLTADTDPATSGAEVLKEIYPPAPNLHNREDFENIYSEIEEVQITTAEGVKTALFYQERFDDHCHLTFLQGGTLVVITGPEEALEGDWLESFSLIPIDSL